MAEIQHFLHLFCYKMAPHKLKNGGQCCLSSFVIRLFISKFWVKAAFQF